MRRITQLLISAVLAQFCIGLGYALDAWNVREVSRSLKSTERTQKFARQGDYLYLNTGLSGLRVLDVTDLSNPHEVANFDDYPGEGADILVEGNIAILAAKQSFRIIDISDPLHPRELGYFYLPGYQTQFGKFAFRNNILYAAVNSNSDEYNGLHSFDISDPQHPRQIGSYHLWGIKEVFIRDSLGVLLAPNGLKVVDLSNPAEIRHVAFVATTGSAKCMALTDNFAFIGRDEDSIHVVDISNLVNPTYMTSYKARVNLRDLTTCGQYLYMVGGLDVWNVSDPIHPAMIGEPNIEDYCYSIEVDETSAFSSSYGMLCFDATNPIDLIKRSDFRQPDLEITSSLVNGDYAVVFDKSSYPSASHGLTLVDISDRRHPTAGGLIDSIGQSVAMQCIGSTLYLTRRSPMIYDVTDLENPVVLRPVTTDYSISMFQIDGDRGFAPWSDVQGQMISRTLLFDLSDPQRPEVIDSLDVTGFFDGNRCYDYDSETKTVQIFDISDPRRIIETGHLQVEGYFRILTIQNDFLYTINQRVNEQITFNGLQIVSVADPRNPQVINELPLPTTGTDKITVYSNHLIHYNSASDTMRIYDITDPTDVRLTGWLISPGKVLDVRADEQYLYISDKTNYGIYDWSDALMVMKTTPVLPFGQSLISAYPNPFNSNTRLSFESDGGQIVRLAIFDPFGRKITDLIPAQPLRDGSHQVIWNAGEVPSGCYMVRLEAGTNIDQRLIQLVK